MKLKDKIITILICSIFIVLYILVNSYSYLKIKAPKIYSVYLNGEVIGSINSKDELYALIDKKQESIKNKYGVNNVFPPNSLQVLESYSYDAKINDVEDIYNTVQNTQDFTIYGYEIKVEGTDNHEKYSVYVLDKQVFFDAIRSFLLAFIDEEHFDNYMNSTQTELVGLGQYYKDMGIVENISIREKHISTNEKIYTDSDELARKLLFGFTDSEKLYEVKEGDTIESISDANSLNAQEFLIANPNYTSKESLLKIGDTVNITLINPQLTFKYTVNEVKKVEYDYDKVTVRDNSKPSSYSEITTPGVKGISLITSTYDVVNGEQNSEEKILVEEKIREKVNQVTTKGRKATVIFGNQRYEDTGSGWRWPTENPYTITSEFSYRWGRFHNGIDISGSGFGSRIFAANDGVVSVVVKGCPDYGSYGSKCGGGYGNYVLIDHGNNLYTLYAHMRNKINVSVGQSVSRGTVIGYMGDSGSSTGTHLHFGFAVGNPFHGGSFKNPRQLYR